MEREETLTYLCTSLSKSDVVERLGPLCSATFDLSPRRPWHHVELKFQIDDPQLRLMKVLSALTPMMLLSPVLVLIEQGPLMKRCCLPHVAHVYWLHHVDLESRCLFTNFCRMHFSH